MPFIVVYNFLFQVREAAVDAQQGEEESQESSVLILVDIW